MKFTFYSTPGHGYLRVPKSKFLEFGGDPEKISRYSGHDESTLYLEEDGDAIYFIDLLRENGIEPELKSVYKGTFAKTHNYDPSLFSFELREGENVKLCSNEYAKLGWMSGNILVARTTKGMVYKIPKTNPFKYITEVL